MAKNPRIPVRLTNEMKKYFEEESLKTGLSQSSLIFNILRDYFENLKKKG